MAERKLVVVKDNVILPELGGIGGPILTPTRIPIDAILKMINNKRHVFECYPNDPRNESLWVELTNANYKLNNFNKEQEPEQQNTNPEGTSNDGSQNPETVTDPVAPATQQAPLDPPVSDPDPVDPDPTADPETEQTAQTNDDKEHTNHESDPEVIADPEGTSNDGSQNPETVTDPETDPVAPATQSDDESQEEEKPAAQQTKSSKKNKKNK